MEKVYIVSVVRNQTMYERCISSNKFLSGAEFVKMDNTEENVAISRRYNSFIDRLGDQDCWIVFCHEDWMAEEPLVPCIQRLGKNRLYGNFGIHVEEHGRFNYIVPFGGLRQGDKCGKKLYKNSGMNAAGRVGTFDCQFLTVHSSLIRQYGLRFDENLDFHLYVEDFCASASEKGLECRTIDIKSIHFSEGVISQSFNDSLAYLRKKYKDSKNTYCSPAGELSVFGRAMDKPSRIKHKTPLRRLLYLLKRICDSRS